MGGGGRVKGCRWRRLRLIPFRCRLGADNEHGLSLRLCVCIHSDVDSGLTTHLSAQTLSLTLLEVLYTHCHPPYGEPQVDPPHL